LFTRSSAPHTLEDWKDESSKDPDVAYLIERISGKKLVALAKLLAKEYYRVWAKNQLEAKDDILYQWEYPKMARLRQLRRRVVPIGLQQAIYTAYHATPLAGHVGFYKTYWRIAARYYWPSMYSDVPKAVLECGHCILGSNTSHQAQQILGFLLMDDEPFDIIAIDIWIPGATKAKGAFIEDKAMIGQAALTSLCNLTGFATVGFLDTLEGRKVTKVLMSQILLPNGLPKLVLLDADSLFKQDLIVLLDELGVGFHVVSAEQHEGILCERFHRYLNKVQRLQGLDTKAYSNWMMNTSFASYAWNGSPIDGSDIIRSFAAKARTFHFPLDVKEQLPRIIGNPGERALQHVEMMFPLWFQQKELLQILVQEQQLRHTEWANRNKKRREFFPGDIVVV
jgi:Integrase zinc binding domain